MPERLGRVSARRALSPYPPVSGANAPGIPGRMKSLFIAVTQRLSGERPAALRAFAGATVAGAAAGAAVYKLLRRD
jgi:hypothetical protein